jgi:hypothetical protein
VIFDEQGRVEQVVATELIEGHGLTLSEGGRATPREGAGRRWET